MFTISFVVGVKTVLVQTHLAFGSDTNAMFSPVFGWCNSAFIYLQKLSFPISLCHIAMLDFLFIYFYILN